MRNRKPDGYYDNFEVLKNDLLILKNKLGRFPNKEEILSNLKIGYWYLRKHGGMYEIKRKLNIMDDKNKFIDNSGFYNNSSYEMIVANFLLENGVSYLREQTVTKNDNYRSDFTLVKENGSPVHVEVWGYLKTNNDKIAIEYNKVRKLKEEAYNSNNLELINIEPTVFYKKNLDSVQKSLIKIFTPFLSMKLLNVKNEILIPSTELSDDELLTKVMEYSIDNEFLPTTVLLKEKNRSLYNQILKRYGNYQKFASKFNKKLEFKSNNHWNKDKVFEIFDYMYYKYGEVLNRSQVSQEKNNDDTIKSYSAIVASIDKMFTSIKDLKVEYFYSRVSRNLYISSKDVKWVKSLSVNQSRRGHKLVSIKTQQKATDLLHLLTPTIQQ